MKNRKEIRSALNKLLFLLVHIDLEYGLCNFINKMDYEFCLHRREALYLIRIVNKIKPYKYFGNTAFYFKPGKKEPRIKYLKDLLKLYHSNIFISNFYYFYFIKITKKYKIYE